MVYIGDHKSLPTGGEPSLEGLLQRGVVSSEAASELTPEETTTQQQHHFRYSTGTRVNTDSRY